MRRFVFTHIFVYPVAKQEILMNDCTVLCYIFLRSDLIELVRYNLRSLWIIAKFETVAVRTFCRQTFWVI
jgi:hypothetical protein